MLNNGQRRRFVKAILVRGAETDETRADLSRELGIKQSAVLVSAAFAAAASRVFTEESSPEEITAYAHRLAVANDGAGVKTTVVEALIRAQFGEAELAAELPFEDMVPHEILVANDIVGSLQLDDLGLRQFADEVLALADQYDVTP
ncbi:MAG: hypothetical protein WCA46_31060 [Actinocatenispora sp.]